MKVWNFLISIAQHGIQALCQNPCYHLHEFAVPFFIWLLHLSFAHPKHTDKLSACHSMHAIMNVKPHSFYVVPIKSCAVVSARSPFLVARLVPNSINCRVKTASKRSAVPCVVVVRTNQGQQWELPKCILSVWYRYGCKCYPDCSLSAFQWNEKEGFQLKISE